MPNQPTTNNLEEEEVEEGESAEFYGIDFNSENNHLL
jgi:hypothetical protein